MQFSLIQLVRKVIAFKAFKMITNQRCRKRGKCIYLLCGSDLFDKNDTLPLT